jgi:phosphoglycolate phosphatase
MVAALLGARDGDVDVALSEFRRRYAATPTPPDCLYSGVRAGLRRLHDMKVGVAVWSNKPQGLCEKIIGELGLSAWCSAIVGTGPGAPHKPDPTGYHEALARIGRSSGSSCLVGDTEIDHAAANNAGAPFVWVSYGYGETQPAGARRADDFSSAVSIVVELLSG